MYSPKHIYVAITTTYQMLKLKVHFWNCKAVSLSLQSILRIQQRIHNLSMINIQTHICTLVYSLNDINFNQ